MRDDHEPVRPRRLVRRRRPKPTREPASDGAVPQEAQDAIKGFGMMVAGATLVAKAAGALIGLAVAAWRVFSPHSPHS